MSSKKVLIIGASTEQDRYSNMAMKSLLVHKHKVVLSSPKYTEIEGHECFKNLSNFEL